MRGSELLEQMEQVEPAYVEAAEVFPKDKKRLSWKVVAAVLCILLGGGLIWNFRGVLLFGSAGVQKPKPAPVTCAVGEAVRNGQGTATLLYHTNDYENGVVAFTMILEEDIVSKNAACMEAYKHLSTRVEVIEGKEYVFHDSERVFVRTPASLIDYVNHAGKWGILEITVDGEPATYLPWKAGTYEIRIDYSKVYEVCDEVKDYVSVGGFGNLLIGPEASE